ncbi:DUF6181 family protein [Streptomyces sp. BI20]|uniref:DUF6181 family protein n=1 Tax=Streptomyces sp. BI20 TaxID=3403460 RepID=UPI003C7078AB
MGRRRSRLPHPRGGRTGRGPRHRDRQHPARRARRVTGAGRGAATPSEDGRHRVSVPVTVRLTATELTRVLLAMPTDLTDITPTRTREAIGVALRAYGYGALQQVRRYDPADARHQQARAAIWRAYGGRFRGTPDAAFLNTPA